ncbi:MAG: sigma-70 family RNA polymerase sigma factor [Clostridia bacterium]|nr:sigma-70 family RNA polymerase sigma factor [Clostridia bacterium]
MLNGDKFERYAKTRSIEERNALVEEYLYMVDILIRKYLNKGVEYDDLYQVAAMALVSAVERFDYTKGFEFTSFATPTILGEIKRYFRDKEWTVRVPRRIKETAIKIPKVKEQLFNDLQRNPTVPELAKALNISEEQLIETLECSGAYAAYSLNQAYGDCCENCEHCVFEKYMAFEEQGYSKVEYVEIVESALKTLTESEKEIFKKRFIKNKSQAEIAAEMGVSQMTISRAEKNIKGKFLREIER